MNEQAFASPDVVLRDLWKSLLQRESISDDATFTALGGNSMLMIQMLVRVSQAFPAKIDYDRFINDQRLPVLIELVEGARS